MKTNFNYFTLAIVALLMVGFSSCSNDDEPAVDNPAETINVFLKISNGPSTRAEGASQAAGAVLFESGHLYFTDANGVIIRYNAIAAGTTGDYTVGGLQTGQTILNLPGTVTNVYVVGNTADNIPTSGNISLVKEKILGVSSQVETTGNVVNLYGMNVITGNAAEVYLAPTVARIELTNITSFGNITDFTVTGIFVDNYYATANVDGTVIAPYTTSTETPADYTNTATKYVSPITEGSVFDWGTWTSATQIVVPTASAAVWGYNLFAGPTTNASGVTENVESAAGITTPRIIIRLSSVTATGDLTFTGPQFITIRGFNDESEVKIEEIKPGHVYKINTGLLRFDESNLSPTPNTNPIDVTVEITVASWVVVPVTPIL